MTLMRRTQRRYKTIVPPYEHVAAPALKIKIAATLKFLTMSIAIIVVGETHPKPK